VRGITETSPRSAARIAGFFELLEAVTSGFGQVIVPRMLVVSGNAAATASNIVTHSRLFHLSILAGIIGAACHIVWTLLFYELFKPVNRTLSLLAAFFSLVAIALQAVSSVFQLGPLVVLEAGASLSAFNNDQLQALALMLVRFNAHALNVYLEAYRVYRRALSERGWSPWDDPVSIPRKCVIVRSGWSWTTPQTTRRSGRRFGRSSRSSGSAPNRCGAGCGRRSGTLVSAPA